MSPVIKILIVDDETDICYFLSRNLSKKGFTTSCSNTLQEAEKELSELNPNILLIDNHLPDGNGIDFASRAHQQYPEMKVIMVTAHDSPADRSKAYKSGVDFFLPKPFSITEIEEVVDRIMTKK